MKIFLQSSLLLGILLIGSNNLLANNLVLNSNDITSYNSTFFTEEMEEEGSFKLSNAYPNPAITFTKLDFKIPTEILEAKIIIRSLLGSVVKEFVLNDFIGTLKIQTNDLSGGIYFYSLKLDKKIVVTRKLIIKH